jgi:hypothetical protein
VADKGQIRGKKEGSKGSNEYAHGKIRENKFQGFRVSM